MTKEPADAWSAKFRWKGCSPWAARRGSHWEFYGDLIGYAVYLFDGGVHTGYRSNTASADVTAPDGRKKSIRVQGQPGRVAAITNVLEQVRDTVGHWAGQTHPVNRPGQGRPT